MCNICPWKALESPERAEISLQHGLVFILFILLIFHAKEEIKTLMYVYKTHNNKKSVATYKIKLKRQKGITRPVIQSCLVY